MNTRDEFHWVKRQSGFVVVPALAIAYFSSSPFEPYTDVPEGTLVILRVAVMPNRGWIAVA